MNSVAILFISAIVWVDEGDEKNLRMWMLAIPSGRSIMNPIQIYCLLSKQMRHGYASLSIKDLLTSISNVF